MGLKAYTESILGEASTETLIARFIMAGMHETGAASTLSIFRIQRKQCFTISHHDGGLLYVARIHYLSGGPGQNIGLSRLTTFLSYLAMSMTTFSIKLSQIMPIADDHAQGRKCRGRLPSHC